MRRTCLEMVYEMARTDRRIVFVGSDLGYGTLDAFRKEMPERFFMEGINEAHVMGMAAGLAMEGKVVYVNTIATFLTRRCFEQIVVDICMHNAQVRLIGNGGGTVYAPLGATHLAFEDIAIMRALPNMTIIAPADAEEMRRLMPYTADYPGPIYIRLAKGNDPIVSPPREQFAIGKGILVRSGTDALIVTTGITLKLALKAAQTLEYEGIQAAILHLPTIKPLDTQQVVEMAEQVKVIVSIEEHSILGGLGSAVAEILAESSISPFKRFRRIGFPDVFPDEYGSQDSLMERYHVTVDAVVKVIKNMMNNSWQRAGVSKYLYCEKMS